MYAWAEFYVDTESVRCDSFNYILMAVVKPRHVSEYNNIL